MNLWRRSKSWFQDSFPTQKENFEPQDYLEQEKQLLKTKYEREHEIIERQFHYELLEAKLRFENELRRLEAEHSQLKAKNNQESESQGQERASSSRDVKISPKKKGNIVENGGDGLEWDPINELKSYDVDETCDSWDAQSEISNRTCSFEQEENSTESRDSAYGSISMELQRRSLQDERGLQTMKRFKPSEVEKKIDQLRASIRTEICRENEEKFREEKKFLYSVIDELEENVALLRKQKEDIVTIFESKEKDIVHVDH